MMNRVSLLSPKVLSFPLPNALPLVSSTAHPLLVFLCSLWLAISQSTLCFFLFLPSFSIQPTPLFVFTFCFSSPRGRASLLSFSLNQKPVAPSSSSLSTSFSLFTLLHLAIITVPFSSQPSFNRPFYLSFLFQNFPAVTLLSLKKLSPLSLVLTVPSLNFLSPYPPNLSLRLLFVLPFIWNPRFLNPHPNGEDAKPPLPSHPALRGCPCKLRQIRSFMPRFLFFFQLIN